MRSTRAAFSTIFFCAFALYIAWHASHHSPSGPLDELPLPAAHGDESNAGAAATEANAPELVKRGQYLARLGDCAACHTSDKSRPFAGGRAIPTPFGAIYSPNITPDPDTGIGQWTDADFVRAMHEGIGKGGQRLYPAFPYVAFTRVTERDVLAIRAYLNTVAPVHYKPPPNELRFPFNWRWLMIAWNLFNFDEGRFVPDPQKSAEFNRGAYLVEGLAHCEECHTPRNFMQGLRKNERFAGATQAGWQAYNITPDPLSGIGGWSDAALRAYLVTGAADGHGSAAGPMAEVVQNSTQYLTDVDVRSITTYLRVQRPIRGGVTRARDTWGQPVADDVTTLRGTSITSVNGAQLFVANCASCHNWTGAGVGASAPGAYPSLVHNSVVGAASPNNLAMVILHGVTRNTLQADVLMPAFDSELTNDQIAAISNYVTKQFGDPHATITPDQVGALRAAQQ
ncbi:cytochrome c [Paraburkholderia dinghuensis]|uniref:Cytochrome c n=2 Tax=Paraburkholderia dinghuensis TaxID=2305225 RepID=A0A3N6MPH8_9BURK|nr:cytochrome c [Paraburkholderia dinghuensis]RQH05834.1 cytochrome c [Paraburkholderia dinghuensis]